MIILSIMMELKYKNNRMAQCWISSKSFTTLINTSYSMKNGWNTSETSFDSGVLSNPISFLRSGYFSWHSVGLNSRGGSGHYWSLRSYSTTYSIYLYFYNTDLYPQVGNNRGDGFAVQLFTKKQPLGRAGCN